MHFTIFLSILVSVFHASAHIIARGDCKTVQVKSGDTCGTLATACGISAADFTKYNSNSKLCSTLAVGQHVCCSAGPLPDLTPKPYANGTCATHLVLAGESCASIAAQYGIKNDTIPAHNLKTWGWQDCSHLQASMRICVSSGNAPMPAPIDSAICGPQKPGTATPSDMSKLADLNPCPLNACCNHWGQCGITEEFCKIKLKPDAAPGTTNCISHCGTSPAKADHTAKTFRKIGYFEVWNTNRPCLTMAPFDISLDAYTAIHYSFAAIEPGTWNVNVSANPDFWYQFKNHQLDRVLSFGGWGFSTDPSTYQIFRDAVSDKNYDAFANSVVAFAENNNLSGLDFDWEYPGAINMTGIPDGSKSDGANYLRFLQTVRARLPKDKTLSIAAPASYWYLKNFPIAEIAKTVDYIVYMTYDLHGQWDYGGQYAAEGCTGGSCIRSHVNLTETNYALAMITKANVPAEKVVVGVSNYGRSFQMSKAACYGPDCTFTGPESGAYKGRCTNSAGILAQAEIIEIAKTNKNSRMWYDRNSNSDYLVFNDTQVVTFMSNDTKSSRTDYYKGLGFAGVVEWAIDLESFDEGNANDIVPEDKPCDLPECTASVNLSCDKTYKSFDDLNKDLSSIPPNCVDQYQIQILTDMLSDALSQYTDTLNHGYDDKYGWYVRAMRDQIPQVLRDFVNNNRDTYFDCSETSGRCPTIPSPSAGGAGTDASALFKMKNETRFYDDLLKQTGIPKEWVMITSQGSTSYGYQGQKYGYSLDKIPVVKGDFPVFNPKDMISSAIGNLTGTRDLLRNALADTKIGMYVGGEDESDIGETTDVVLGASLPAMMVKSAVESMSQVADIGEKAKEEFTKSLILDFVMAALAIIPAVGEYMAGADIALIASMGRIAQAIGDAGDVAFTSYTVSEDPTNAVFLVFSALGATRSFKSASTKFQEIKPGTLGKKIDEEVASMKKGFTGCL